MGTLFRIVCYAPSEEHAARACEAALARVRALDERLSDYRADSEVSRLAAAMAEQSGTWHEVSADLASLLRHAQDIADGSEGAFDVTVGPLSRLWRRARRREEAPSDEQVTAALECCGYEHWEVDGGTNRVRNRVPGMRLDLGAIGKGFAADAALEVLSEHGITSALVDAGGDVTVGAAPPDRDAWHIRVDPSGEGGFGLDIANESIATSGDLHQFVVLDGERLSHLVDPRTGRAMSGRRSATVIARCGAEADALASALCVLAPEEGLALARSRRAEACVRGWVDGSPFEARTPGFRSPAAPSASELQSPPLPSPHTRKLP